MNLAEKINKLKKEKNAVILTHCYQNIELDEVSDYIGDSLYLSRTAAQTDADIIVFAGVYFMAQSAKLLSPDKKVLLPNMNSGCLMANMIDIESLREFKEKNPNLPVVCYVNSTAEVKSECDICCTSSNAVEIVRSLNKEKILFVPDTYLGKYVEKKLGNVEVITFNGFCPTHLRILPEDVASAREKYPDALILAHPECHCEVSKSADFVGSTKEIMEFAEKSDSKQFIIATEKGVVDRLSRNSRNEGWGKEFILIKSSVICQNMKHNTLEDVYNALRYEQHEIDIEENIRKKAADCIKKMIYAGNKN